MGAIAELIRNEADGSLSFGDYTLSSKAKKEDFEHSGDLYKVKTFGELTKLEKNGLFVYESVPGTAVANLKETADGMTFTVEGKDDAQLTLGLKDDTEYQVFVDGASAGKMKTSLGGKLSVSVELSEGRPVEIRISK